MSLTEELSTVVEDLARTNASLAVSAKVLCGSELTPFRVAYLDAMHGRRQAALDWLQARHIIVEVGDSVYRPGRVGLGVKG